VRFRRDDVDVFRIVVDRRQHQHVDDRDDGDRRTVSGSVVTGRDSLQRNVAVARLRPVSSPFPHALADGFFHPAVYERLREEFPTIAPASPAARGERTLYWGDEDYERCLERSPAWKDVFGMVQSQAFVDFMIETFADHWEREGCTLDLSKTRYVSHVEDRTDKERLTLRRVDHDPHDLWCRLDFSQSGGRVYGPLHRDQRRRLVSMFVYFDHPGDPASLDGGLLLHRTGTDLELLRALKVGRVPEAYSHVRDRVAAATRGEARPNRMIVLLNGNRSWHSVPKPPPARLPARHVRIVVSSSMDAWR